MTLFFIPFFYILSYELTFDRQLVSKWQLAKEKLHTSKDKISLDLAFQKPKDTKLLQSYLDLQ